MGKRLECSKLAERAATPYKANEAAKLSVTERVKGALSRFFGYSPEWKLDSDIEMRIKSIENDASLGADAQAVAISEAVTEGFLRRFSPKRKAMLTAILKKAQDKIETHSAQMPGRYSSSVGGLLGGRPNNPKTDWESPMYAPLEKAIINVETLRSDDPRASMVLLHETVHASQRGQLTKFIAASVLHNTTLFRWPFYSSVKWAEETAAIGSQWEIARKMSPELRKKLIEAHSPAVKVIPDLSEGINLNEVAISVIMDENRKNDPGFDADLQFYQNNPFGQMEVKRVAKVLKDEFERISFYENLYTKIFVASLEYANLSKSEFIQKMRLVTSATMAVERSHDRAPKFLKYPLLYLGASQVGSLLASATLQSEDESENKDKLEKAIGHAPPLDIQVMIRIYAWLTLSE